ncbi:MAG: ribonuclease III [Clostridia bacterium]
MNNLDIDDIQKKIGYKFDNLDYLFTAFTHASYANERAVPSNERLEFLGDSILNFVIARCLFDKFPLMDEGFLTKARAKIVSVKPLSAAVEENDIFKYLRHAQGTIGEGGASAKVKSRLFEAIVGAIMLDGGLKFAEEFILTKLTGAINGDFSDNNLSDYKSRLLEESRRAGKAVVFVTNAKEGGGFVAIVYVDGKALGTGEAATKKKAEQLAAKDAYCS